MTPACTGITMNTLPEASSSVNPVCEQCGKPFQKKHPKQRFCSEDCRGKWHYEQGSRVKDGPYTCKGCGILYHPKAPDRTCYCSRACFQQGEKARWQEINESLAEERKQQAEEDRHRKTRPCAV